MNFSCEHCDQEFEAGEEWAGQSMECPTCGEVFVASAASAPVVKVASLPPPTPPPTPASSRIPAPVVAGPVSVRPSGPTVHRPPMRPPGSNSYVPVAEEQGGGFSTFLLVAFLLILGSFLYASYYYNEPPRQLIARIVKYAQTYGNASADQKQPAAEPQVASEPKAAQKSAAPVVPNFDQPTDKPEPSHFGEPK